MHPYLLLLQAIIFVIIVLLCVVALIAYVHIKRTDDDEYSERVVSAFGLLANIALIVIVILGIAGHVFKIIGN